MQIFLSPAVRAGTAAMLLMAAPAHADAQRFVDKVYEGVLTARVQPPIGSGIRVKTSHGSATAELKRTGPDTARFVLIGNVEQDNDASFGAQGRFENGAWRGGDSIPVTISADGAISGKGQTGDHDITIDGQIDDNRINAFVEVRPRSATGGGYPVGTTFQFKYTLRHFKPASASRGSGKGSGKCREIVYRMKLVPNFSGGPMGMVRVPECRR